MDKHTRRYSQSSADLKAPRALRSICSAVRLQPQSNNNIFGSEELNIAILQEDNKNKGKRRKNLIQCFKPLETRWH
jgi:hypothetical protein